MHNSSLTNMGIDLVRSLLVEIGLGIVGVEKIGEAITLLDAMKEVA